MKNEQECTQFQYTKLMENNNIKDIKAAWCAGVAWGKHLAKNTTDDSTVLDFYTWTHKYFLTQPEESIENDKKQNI